ncbi:3-deoxy-manno-octulosonate cytidylyltransferase [Simonsiella muelleri]|uniref:3-deoxy-manno-octulosonate cytidylyltransferase n=1 Tax=Simonsiella muelleri TaxID=72 RepID=UPI0036F41C30
MKFTIILPARLSSSRLPEKALADIAGKPMIVRAAEQAAQSHAQKIIVATDHPRIQAACTAHQIATVMTSEQHTSGTTRLAEAAQLLDLADDEIVVNVQGDEPLIPPELIERVAQKLANNNAPMATAAHYIHDFNEFINPNCVKVVLNQAGNALYFSRAPIAYPRDLMLAGKAELPHHAPLRHIGIYAYRVDFLKKYANLSASPLEICESLEQLRVLWHGYEIAVEVLDSAPPAGVDTVEDLVRVRTYFD